MSGRTSLLAKILVKICLRYEKRGSLTGGMKLGQDLHDADRLELENFFGLAPLTHTGKNELKLSLSRLLARKTPAAVEAWLDHVYREANRPRVSSPEGEDDYARLFLEQFRLAFPRLRAIHFFLRHNQQTFAGKLQKHPEEIRTFFFRIGEIVEFLLENKKDITLSELGARFFRNSKRLRQGEAKKTLRSWLHLLRPDLEEDDVWDAFFVVRDRLTITALIYAPLIYTKNGREYDWINQLYQAGEPAMVSWFHLEGMDSLWLDLADKKEMTLITCENEAPFSQLLREKTTHHVLFTSGFPNRAVCKLYELLSPHCAACKHWGDSDPAGLRIAALLHELHPLQLWRCDLATLEQYKDKLLSLDENQQCAASTILKNDLKFQFSAELAFTRKFGWLEQENWLLER